MTAENLFYSALALLQEDAERYEEYYLSVLNTLLSETYEINQHLRRSKGLNVLKDIPVLDMDGDEIPYEEELVRSALPYGLASRISLDDNDVSKCQFLHNVYAININALNKGYATAVADCYAGGEL